MKIFGKDAPKSKPQRSTHGEQLAKALNWIITDDMFAEVALHGNIYFTRSGMRLNVSCDCPLSPAFDSPTSQLFLGGRGLG